MKASVVARAVSDPPVAARAEFDPLNAVRVHAPGPELLAANLDPEASLFYDAVPPERARREHDRIVDAFESAGVTVHRMADDLAAAGALDPLVREAVGGDAPGVESIRAFSPREKLSVVLCRPHVLAAASGTERTAWGRPAESEVPSVRLERPITNVYFQRDHNLLTDRGPVLANMYESARQPELPLVRAAWEGVGAEPVHEVTAGPIEGGDFLPAGEFALVGTSAVVDGEEVILRTSHAAGEELLDSGALGYDEVGLVRAPLAAGREMAERHDTGTRVLHLDGWLNLPAEGLAVTRERLAAAATVEVYARRGDRYRHDRTTTVLEYLDARGYEFVHPDWAERWPTNFVTVDDGRVVAIHRDDPDGTGEYRPERNPTIETLRERGVEILPDGTGLCPSALTRGGGGVHCMTTPISRG